MRLFVCLISGSLDLSYNNTCDLCDKKSCIYGVISTQNISVQRAAKKCSLNLKSIPGRKEGWEGKYVKDSSNLSWQWLSQRGEWQASIITQAYKVRNGGGGGQCVCAHTPTYTSRWEPGGPQANKTSKRIPMHYLFPTLTCYLSTEKTAKTWQIV